MCQSVFRCFSRWKFLEDFFSFIANDAGEEEHPRGAPSPFFDDTSLGPLWDPLRRFLHCPCREMPAKVGCQSECAHVIPHILIPQVHDPVSRRTTTATPSPTTTKSRHHSRATPTKRRRRDVARRWKIPHDCVDPIGERVRKSRRQRYWTE